MNEPDDHVNQTFTYDGSVPRYQYDDASRFTPVEPLPCPTNMTYHTGPLAEVPQTFTYDSLAPRYQYDDASRFAPLEQESYRTNMAYQAPIDAVPEIFIYDSLAPRYRYDDASRIGPLEQEAHRTNMAYDEPVEPLSCPTNMTYHTGSLDEVPRTFIYDSLAPRYRYADASRFVPCDQESYRANMIYDTAPDADEPMIVEREKHPEGE